MVSDRFVNRELSWLEFNRRVLEEAQDPSVPLLERLKFLSIFSSNLDEFFMVRVAALKRRIHDGEQAETPDGPTPLQAMAAVSARCTSWSTTSTTRSSRTSSRSSPARASCSCDRRRSPRSSGVSSRTTSATPSCRW